VPFESAAIGGLQDGVVPEDRPERVRIAKALGPDKPVVGRKDRFPRGILCPEWANRARRERETEYQQTEAAT
jgi:hypothetical protein